MLELNTNVDYEQVSILDIYDSINWSILDGNLGNFDRKMAYQIIQYHNITFPKYRLARNFPYSYFFFLER